MLTNRAKSFALVVTTGIAALLAVMALVYTVEQRRTKAETGAVLSAFFSQTVLHDMEKWAEGRTVEIVVQRKPDCGLCPGAGVGFETHSWFARSFKARASSVSDDPWFAQSSRTTRATFLLNSLFSTDISTDLRLPSGARAVFVSPSDLGSKPSDFEVKFPNNLGYFVVSRIGLNANRTEALLYFDHFCAGLCGGGAYVLMRKVDGAWYVADQRGTWVS